MISYMKKILAIGLFSILTVACTPYFVSYKHLYIEDQAGLSVVEYGNPIVNENITLFFREEALPVVYLLKRERYKILINTKINDGNIVFSINADDGMELRSNVILETPYDNYSYIYWHEESRDTKFILIEVLDKNSEVLRVERIDYHFESIGYVYGLDAI
jgi:hypothetical protein